MITKQSKSLNKLKYKKTAIVLFVAFIVFTIGCTKYDSGKGWRTYRQNDSRTAVTSEIIPSQLSLKWTYIPTHAPNPAWDLPAEEMKRMHMDNTYHVSAVNGIAYFGSSVDNKVYALDISTGKEKWVFFTEGPVRFSPTIWNNRIYFGSDDGFVYCLKAGNGKMIWKYRPGPKDKKVIGSGRMISLWPIRTSVLVKDKTVYCGAGVFPYDGLYICALNAKNGSIIWKNDDLDDDVFDLEYGGVSPQSYLIASEEKLFVPSGRAMPAVFDRKNGKFLYYLSPSGKQGGTWGMLDQGELIAGVDRSGTPTKVSYDVETGEINGDVYASFTGIDMVGTGNISFVVTENGIYAIDRVEYPVIQQKIDSVRKEQNRLVNMFRSRIYNTVLTEDASFEKQLDELTNKLNSLMQEEEGLKELSSKWFFSQENLNSIILTGNQVIAGGKDIVIGVDKETGEKLWQCDVEGVANGLSVSDQSLIVSTDKGPIYCFKGEKGNNNEAKGPVIIEPSIIELPYTKDNMVYEEAAKAILSRTSVNKGYCLVLDCGEGQLAFELAKKSDLKIIGIEKNLKKVRKAKEKLDKAGLYGEKIIVENWSINSLPEYFADLIVSGDILSSEQINLPPDEIFRVLKPGGGVACFGKPEFGNTSIEPKSLEKLAEEWKPLNIQKPEIISESGNWIILTRNALIGAGGWTHQYADNANTCCSDDKLVMAPFSTLWYGPPGPQFMVERHAKANAPIAFDGKMIVEGENIIMAYDAYNGTKLWERKIEGAVRVRADADGGNMAVNKFGLFIAAKNRCIQLDIETGETIQTFELPDQWKTKNRRWGYIAVKNNILFGSSALPLSQDYGQIYNTLIDDEGELKNPNNLSQTEAVLSAYYKYKGLEDTEKLEQEFQRAGTEWRPVKNFPDWSGGISGLKDASDEMMISDGMFAKDIKTGKTLWIHEGKEIAQITICVGDQTVFFAEKAVSPLQKKKTLIKKQKYIRNGKWETFKTKLGPDEADIRIVYALDISTGEEKWENVIDLSGCGDNETASAYKNNVLLFFGSYGLHDKWRFPAGQLKWHRITALSANNGELMWSRPLNYMVRPVFIKDEIIIEPRKCDLYTGEIKTRIHPVTGKQVPWEFYRPGHTCAITSANDNCLFYRSYNAAYYDLKEDKGMNYYGAIRPGCLINMIPGNGLVLMPEASSGCTCSFPLRTSVVLKPEKKEDVEDWSLYISHGAMTPVQHFAINLGAPGDKKDNNGTIWFGYPRPEIQTGLKFDIDEEITEGMGFYSYDSKGVEIEGSDYPWLYTNGCIGLKKCEILLIDNLFGEEAGVYTVRLGFVASSIRRMFDIKIQDNIVLEKLDVLKEAGDINRTIIKEFKGIDVKDILSIELIPETFINEVSNAPVINFIEVIREDTPEKKSVLITDEALDKYHKILKESTGKELKIKALEGMETIASVKSLPEIKKYCKNPDPIMWGYKEPDQEVVDAAIKVFIAIANNLANEDKEKAEKMLAYSIILKNNYTVGN